jgi:DNA-binding MarR family transcriptional regulator
MADSNSSGVSSIKEQLTVSVPNKLIYLNERSTSFEEALNVLARVLPEVDLTKIQELVFCHCWAGSSYPEIAKLTDYDADYVKDVGYRLWRQLSDALGESINKQNFRAAFKQRLQQSYAAQGVEPLLLGGSNVANFPERWQGNQAYCDWGEAGELNYFEGRVHELARLKSWVLREQCRLVGLFGIGGIGKTALAMKLAEQVQPEFDFLLWRSLRNTPSPEALLQNLLQRLSKRSDLVLPETTDEQISLLIQFLRQHRCLLVLDDWNAILRGGGEQLAGVYADGHGLYGQLLRRIGESRHQSCLIITSREKPMGGTLLDDKMLSVRSMPVGGLTHLEGKLMLQGLGLSAADTELEALCRYYGGNPFALKVISKTILDLFDGDTAQFLSQKVTIYGQIRNLLEQQFQRLSSLEKRVIATLAQRIEGSSLSELQESLNLNQETLLEVLESLDRRSLIKKKNLQFSVFRLPRKFISLTMVGKNQNTV